jgi:cellulose synthase/poly-beta-1,6-N-acetylglucosamine synthase-like glycosyltransferase
MPDTVALFVMVLTLGVLAFLVPFAFHRTMLLLLSGRSRSEHVAPWPEEQLPRVTVQVPIYNERHVVARLIDHACQIDYPASLLEVQVLDDSDDSTALLAKRRVAYWQARGVDGHFLFEQGGRYTGDRFFNFNGTAGVWRRACLEGAGGWQSDTLTEDLDLSYRAQMIGWRFVYLDPDVLVQSCGVGHVAVWFNVPDDFEGECGEYPAAAIREHLAELGFLRVVVAARNQGGGLCSFSP